MLNLTKNALLSLMFLFPVITDAGWLFTAGCGATVKPTCIESMYSCNDNGTATYTIKSSVLVMNSDGVTPFFANIIYDVRYDDPESDWSFTNYNQGGQCGWSGPACTADAPYDQNTESCSPLQPSLSNSCYYTDGLVRPEVDAAAQDWCTFYGGGVSTFSHSDQYGNRIYSCSSFSLSYKAYCNATPICNLPEVYNDATNTCVIPLPNNMSVKTLGNPSCESINTSVGGN